MKPEEIDQIKVMEWIQVKYPEIYPLTVHVANERRCSLARGFKLKRMGVKAGFPDIFIAYPVHPYHGLFIELKVGKNKATETQKDMLEQLSAQGYMCALVWGHEAAEKVIESYLEIPA